MEPTRHGDIEQAVFASVIELTPRESRLRRLPSCRRRYCAHYVDLQREFIATEERAEAVYSARSLLFSLSISLLNYLPLPPSLISTRERV